MSASENVAESAYWSLLHIKTETQIDSLTFTQIALLVGTFSPEEIDNWAAWHEGEEKWKLLSAHLTTLKIERKTRLYKSQPAPPVSIEREFDATSQVTRLELPEMKEDSRMSKRFIKKYRAFLQAGGESFDVLTADISMTGIRLEKSLPLSVGGTVAVTLVNKKNESVELICSIIKDEKNNRLKITRSAKLDVLQKWLLNPDD